MSERHVFLVCQRRWTNAENNSFCKLAPLMTTDGHVVDSGDFPNDGEAWWMLINQTRALAIPGTLVTANLQEAFPPDRNSPIASLRQAERESVRKMGPETGYSIIKLEGFTGTKLEHIVDGSFKQLLSYQPTERAFVRCMGKVVGPLRVDAIEGPEGWRASFKTPNQDRTVFSVSEGEFTSIVGKTNTPTFREPISQTNDHRSKGGNQPTVELEILLTAGYNHLLTSRPSTVLLESTSEKLARIASQLGITRAKRQQLKTLLQELDLGQAQIESREDYETLIQEVSKNLESHETSLGEMTEVFLKSSLFGEDRIKKAEERFAQQYLESRKASLDSEIQAQTRQLQQCKQELEKDVQRMRQEEASLKKRQEDIAKNALKQERQSLENDLRQREQALQSEMEALKSLQETIQGSLDHVAVEMREQGDAIVKRYLAMEPLLRHMVKSTDQTQSQNEASVTGRMPDGLMPLFEFPPYLSVLANTRIDSEQKFIERFEDLVQSAGLSYRDIDLRRFHISAKTGGLVVLGGPSGTGKSTLPQLYGRALLGDAFGEESGWVDCLMISVSPGWMDAKDIMGYINTMDGKFHPSETGLYLELLQAEHEHQQKDGATPVRLICLDEMNLAQPEHYFGDVITVLEREGPQKRVRVFSSEACGPNCQFRQHGSIKLSPALRFIGTVNFDETTRLLSDRLLDRSNLIELRNDNLPSITGWNPDARANGAPVTVSDFADWVSQDALPPGLAGILDELRPHLTALGCGISPRTYRGLCTFVASSKGLLSPGEAFDLQLAQRIIPRLRNVHTRAQTDALDKIAKITEESADSQFQETLRRIEAKRAETLNHEWDAE